MLDDKMKQQKENSKDTIEKPNKDYNDGDQPEVVISDNVIEEEIQIKESEIAELKDKLLRAMAENENIRWRYEKQLEEAREYSIFNFAKDMVSVLDNLNRALKVNSQELTNEAKNIIAGVEMTKKELLSVFNKHDIEEIIPAVGDKFDYKIHNAISKVSSNSETPQGSIVNVMELGYKLKSRLLRAAIVSVAN